MRTKKTAVAPSVLQVLALAFFQSCKAMNNDYDLDEAVRQLKDLAKDHPKALPDDFKKCVRKLDHMDGTTEGPHKLILPAFAQACSNATVAEILDVMGDMLNESEYLAAALCDTVNMLRAHLTEKLKKAGVVPSK